MIRNYRDLTRLEMEKVDKENTIILIPLGALEQHGNQAPLGTDDIIAEAMVKQICIELEKIGESDFPMLLFPVIPVGLSTEHKNFCGSITMRPDTYYHILYDISVSLARHGFKKLAFLICHGGEMETSMVMAVDESLVKLETSEAGIPAPFVNNKKLLPYGSVSIGWVSEDWRTEDGKPIGIGGDPKGATAEKGRTIIEVSARELIPGLLEIRDWKN